MGGYFGAFNDSYLRSRDLSRREGQADLEEALTLDRVRQQAQEQQDLAGLVGAYQDRRRVLTAGGGQPGPAGAALPAPTTSLPPLSRDQAFGLEEAGVPLSAAPTTSIAPTSAAPAGAPAGEGPRRKALLETLQPDVAGRLLRSGAGRTAIKDLVDAEREQELEDVKKAAAPLFTQAAEAAKSGDGLAYYDSVSKAFRILGNHQAAGQYLEHAMKLRSDAKDLEATNGDLGRWATANETYKADPTPENRQKLLEELSKASGSGSREIRRQLTANYFKGIFDQNPQVMGFNRQVAAGYQAAFADGRAPDAEKIYREAAKADPQGFQAYVFEAMANQKALPEVVRKKVLRWEEVDVKDIPKDRYAWAWRRTEARLPGVSQNDPKFLEALNQELAAAVKTEQQAKADERSTSPYEEARNLRADVDAARKRLHDVRAELRNVRDPMKGEPDPARERDLVDEETAAKRNLDFYEGKMGKKAGLPAEPQKRTPLAAEAPPVRLKSSDIKYPSYARKAFSTLTGDGQTPDQAAAAMVAKGWDREVVDMLRQTTPKSAPEGAPAPGSPAPQRPAASSVPTAALTKGAESSEYRQAATAEIARLKAAGYSKDEVLAEMRKAGWK
jgi:tetratricopeptide (TPR) repeat protein